MTLTLEIAPDVERALEAQAAQLGVPLDRYAVGVLQRQAENNGDTREYSQEVAQRLSAWHSLDKIATSVDVDDSRASIYAERGL